VPLHPQCRDFLDQLAASGGRPLHELTPVEARARAMPPDLAGPEQPVHQVEDRRVPGDGGMIAVRINYRLIPDQQLIEFVCNENEQSSKHYVTK